MSSEPLLRKQITLNANHRRVALAVAHGMNVNAIGEVLGLRGGSRDRVINRMMKVEAFAQVRQRRKGASRKGICFQIPLPSGCGIEGEALIGRNGPRWRLIGWRSGKSRKWTGAEDVSVVVSGEVDAMKDDEARRWLDRSLGACSTSKDETTRRLWIILAHSNGWLTE